MVPEPNAYCERLGIAVPSLATACAHPDANTYALLIVALLERGRPMTLEEVALRFEAAGVVAHVDDAYFSLKRCRPARAPVYRDRRPISRKRATNLTAPRPRERR